MNLNHQATLQIADHMIRKVLDQLGSILMLHCSQLSEDQTGRAYYGVNFQLGNKHFKFRKAKITPKKAGLFVALWKRGTDGKTIPFTADDHFDYYLISVEQDQYFGLFVFPKQALVEHTILTAGCQMGKRGFRIYPDWSIPTNKQATKSKQWQHRYFVDFCGPRQEAKNKLTHILQSS
ncbi:MepB family protein [Sphingobacterium sp. Lzh-3]|uniref:MepB family protein n=1 Tax=Sphingobacterium sp. Lzh-3 TaxID=3382150 RepID=UPI00398CA02A